MWDVLHMWKCVGRQNPWSNKAIIMTKFPRICIKHHGEHSNTLDMT